MDEKREVKVVSGKTNTQLLTVPPKSNGYWIGEAIIIIGIFTLPFWLQ
jgi:hypothetical protein